MLTVDCTENADGRNGEEGAPSIGSGLKCRGKRKQKLAGWVARTRPLAEPLSPRGPQPVLRRLRTCMWSLNGSPEPPGTVLG
jgi:hypothetical protein